MFLRYLYIAVSADQRPHRRSVVLFRGYFGRHRIRPASGQPKGRPEIHLVPPPATIFSPVLSANSAPRADESEAPRTETHGADQPGRASGGTAPRGGARSSW